MRRYILMVGILVQLRSMGNEHVSSVAIFIATSFSSEPTDYNNAGILRRVDGDTLKHPARSRTPPSSPISYD